MRDPILGAILAQDEMIDRAEEISKEKGIEDPVEARMEAIAEKRGKLSFARRPSGWNEVIKMVSIKRDKNGDTRSADHIPTISEFQTANERHRSDVVNMAHVFALLIESAAVEHDWTKMAEPYSSMFYRDMVATMNGHIKFEDGEWAHLHYEKLERHHLGRKAPDDVNLIDVVEMICDCVVAGMARTGEVRPVVISSEVLQKAVKNTVELLKGYIEIEPDYEGEKQ